MFVAIPQLLVATILLSSFAGAETPPLADRQESAEPVETYSWRRVAIGGGGFITGYDSDPTGQTRVARTDVHGAYLWLSQQDRWAQLVNSTNMPAAYRNQNGINEGVYEIVVAPSRPQRIFMATKGRVFRSDDRGGTFAEASGGLPRDLRFHPNSETRNAGPFLAVSDTDPDLVLLGTPEHGLWRSPDAGASWSQIESVPLASRTHATPAGPPTGVMLWFKQGIEGRSGQIWALSPGHGIFASKDSGRSFTPLAARSDIGPVELSQGVFARDGTFFGVDRTSQALWRFRDGTWSELVAEKRLPPAAFIAVAVNPRNGQVMAFDQGGRTFRSGDGGASWMRLLHRSRPGDRDPPWLRVSNQSYFAMGRVMFDPVVPDRLWAGTGTGVYYADTSGLLPLITWVSEARGIEELVATDIVQGSGQAPLFAALDFGVHRKEDLFTFSTSYGPKERVLIAVQQLALTPSLPGFVATNASDTRISCCAEDGDAVLAGYSTNGGVRWQKFGSLPTPSGTDQHDPWRMSFGSIAVSASSADNIVWEPSFNRTPHYTTDRGSSWQPITLDGRSASPGSHTQRFLTRKTLAADGLRGATFYLAYPKAEGAAGELAGLWRSVDGGRTWQHRFRAEIAPDSGYAAKLRAMPGREGDLFFTSAVSGGRDVRLRRSRDGGSTWQVVPDVEQVDDLAFGKAATAMRPPTIFLSGRIRGLYGIWRSVDDARSWTMIGRHPVGSLDQVTVVGADPDKFGRVYVGYMGSGFVAGEARSCPPNAHRFQDPVECFETVPAPDRRP